MTKYYNIKRIKEPSFEERNKMYLLRKNIITKQPNNKLDFKKFGPFTIIQKISKHNYKLLLSQTIQIYLIFHISLFEFTSESVQI